VFQLIEHALRLSQATQGAFDITVAPLLRAWGMLRGSGRLPDPQTLGEARACVGAGLVELDPDGFRVGFRRPGMMLDLGSIGKGYALDRTTELLREAGIESALIHGGTSTVIGIGKPPDAPAWKVAIERPSLTPTPPAAEPSSLPVAVVELHDDSLSVSAVWGKGFEAGGQFYGHVIDPVRGQPVSGTLLAAVMLPLATESDALSTALLVRGRTMLEALRRGDKGPRCLLMEPADIPAGYCAISSGISINEV
jgi:thiamine biosynthesis lipoprotein